MTSGRRPQTRQPSVFLRPRNRRVFLPDGHRDDRRRAIVMDSFSSVARRELSRCHRGPGRSSRRTQRSDDFAATRRFNNWIKAVCIDEARAQCQSSGDTVQFVDIGCGKGGDVAKCMRGRARLLATDPCADSLRVATQRHGAVPGIQLLLADACSARDRARVTRSLPHGRADVVVCMFVSQHAFDSPWRATMFCDTLASVCAQSGVQRDLEETLYLLCSYDNYL